MESQIPKRAKRPKYDKKRELFRKFNIQKIGVDRKREQRKEWIGNHQRNNSKELS